MGTQGRAEPWTAPASPGAAQSTPVTLGPNPRAALQLGPVVRRPGLVHCDRPKAPLEAVAKIGPALPEAAISFPAGPPHDPNLPRPSDFFLAKIPSGGEGAPCAPRGRNAPCPAPKQQRPGPASGACILPLCCVRPPLRSQHGYLGQRAVISACRTITSACFMDAMSTSLPL